MINVNISANLCIGASSGLAAFSMGHTAERIRVAGNFLFGATRFGVDAFSSNKGTVGNELVGNVVHLAPAAPDAVALHLADADAPQWRLTANAWLGVVAVPSPSAPIGDDADRSQSVLYPSLAFVNDTEVGAELLESFAEAAAACRDAPNRLDYCIASFVPQPGSVLASLARRYPSRWPKISSACHVAMVLASCRPSILQKRRHHHKALGRRSIVPRMRLP